MKKVSEKIDPKNSTKKSLPKKETDSGSKARVVLKALTDDENGKS